MQKTDIKIALLLGIPILASLFISDSIPLYGFLIIFSIAWTIRYSEFAAAVFLTESYLFTAYFNLFEIEGLMLSILVISLLIIALISQYYYNKPNIPEARKHIILLYLVLGIGFLLALQTLHSPSKAYAFQKTGLYFYFNVIFFLIPCCLFPGKKAMGNIFKQGSIVGVFLIILTLIIVFTSNGQMDRFDPSGRGNVIWFPRVMGLVIFFLYYVYLISKNNAIKVFTVLFIIAAVFLINIGGSRGPLVALLGSVIFYLMIIYRGSLYKKVLLAAVSGITAIVATVLILPHVVARFTEVSDDASGMLRIYSAVQSWHFFKLSPLFGHGTGSFSALVNERLLYPHNIFLEMAMENGMIMLILFSSLLFYTFLKLFQQRKMAETKNERYVFDVGILIFLFGLINAQFSGDIPHNPLVWFSAGMAFRTYFPKPD